MKDKSNQIPANKLRTKFSSHGSIPKNRLLLPN